MGELYYTNHKLNAFVSGLNDRLQRHIATALLTSPNMSYDELVALALQHESIGKPTHVDGPAMRRVEHADRQSDSDSDSQHDASQEPSHSGTCPYCRAQGHTWDDCPKIQARKDAGTWRESNPPRRRSRQ